MSDVQKLKKKDFVSDQDIRWCPGCGDYTILNTVQKVLPELGIPKHQFLIVSGIGCSSRFPYYMNCYGFHSIHGRAPAVATGAKLSNPDLSVWVITGDGDAMSIGGNHFIHVLRRNIDMNILLFNNRIYGLTKGQYSPTSEVGKKTVSTPMGSLDHPFNPPALALGSEGTFVARAIDKELKHMGQIITEANSHKGTSFVEIYQNCNIFNDGAFENLTDKQQRGLTRILLEHDKPMIFGPEDNLGLVLDGFRLKVVEIGKEHSIDDLLVHNVHDKNLANLVSEMTYDDNLPVPFGVFYKEDKLTYEDMMMDQIKESIKLKGDPDLQSLINGQETWEVK
ncbi:MAG: 2-oxoacid:ferredoxin oxidoreductase subunit beta [Candidatus Marinimicrobia bacterium]|nr:2-oxoacid:ferredoxin oxidoreductase subunit beta [Candidatus Neomarinimicrobiota bacterium]|tara:strand:- start:2439 stop:3449 length:1011 start_codon:yes stop_codon:yes gene_type:complete